MFNSRLKSISESIHLEKNLYKTKIKLLKNTDNKNHKYLLKVYNILVKSNIEITEDTITQLLNITDTKKIKVLMTLVEQDKFQIEYLYTMFKCDYNDFRNNLNDFFDHSKDYNETLITHKKISSKLLSIIQHKNNIMIGTRIPCISWNSLLNTNIISKFLNIIDRFYSNQNKDQIIKNCKTRLWNGNELLNYIRNIDF